MLIFSNPIFQKYWFIIAMYGGSVLFNILYKPQYRPKNQHFIPSYSHFVFDQGFRIYFLLLLIVVMPLYIVVGFGLKVNPMPSPQIVIIACIPIVLGILYKMWMYSVKTYIQKMTRGFSLDLPRCSQCSREFVSNKKDCPYCKISLIQPEERSKEYYHCRLIERRWDGVWIEVKSAEDGMDQMPDPASLFLNSFRELFIMLCIVGCIGMAIVLWNIVQGRSII